ncbi:MAG: hypothetical protein ACTSWD_08390 [Candidatus Heimdallarchaeota archaeon]
MSDTYINTSTKLSVQCPEGHEYLVKYNCFKQGQRCPVCGNNKRRLSYSSVKRFIESDGHKLLSESYKNVHTKLSIQCEFKHVYDITFLNFRQGHRCPYCFGNKKHTYNYVKKFLREEGYTILSKNYNNALTKLSIQCPKGHVYKAHFNIFQRGSRCPTCNAIEQSSKGERDVGQFVKSLGVNIIENDRTQIVNPLTGYNLELDIWIPELNKAIEYNGAYWHDTYIQQQKDNIKKQQCQQLGIDLLIIHDDKWKEQQQLEQRLIKSWLNQ